MKSYMYIRVLLICLLLGAFAEGTLIRITGLKCHIVDPTFLAFENCVMKPVRRGVKEINMVVRLLQVPVTNVTVRVDIFRRGYATQSLFHSNIDGCQFWLSKRRNPIAHAVYKFLRLDIYSNVNHSCPYDHDLYIDHLPFDKDLNLGLPIGKGEYVLKMHWRTYNVPRCSFDVNMQITD